MNTTINHMSSPHLQIQARLRELALNHIKNNKFRPIDFETLPKRIEELSKLDCTPLSISQAYALGKTPSDSVRLKNAQFLHNELPIRISQRIKDLKKLPHGLSEMKEIKQAIQWYKQYANDILLADPPKTLVQEEHFTELLSSVLVDTTTVPRALSLGIKAFNKQRSRESDWRIARDIDEHLRAFFTARIGIRFLIEQHLLSRVPRPGWAGIIQNDCNVLQQMDLAVHSASQICRHHFGAVPSIQLDVADGGQPTFTYVTSHLQYILKEVLKNSFRAVVETHHPLYKGIDMLRLPEEEQRLLRKEALQAGGAVLLPPVRVVLSKGEEDVVVKIADEGGGVNRQKLRHLWHFFYSTAPTPKDVICDLKTPQYSFEELRREAEGRAESTVCIDPELDFPALAGYGTGLSLSRVMAEYFGGSLELKSMEGFGMDCYIHLNRLGQNCENLPRKVLDSPAHYGVVTN